MAIVNHAVGDRHRRYRPEGDKRGDDERLGPVDTGRGSGCLGDNRVSRPDAAGTGTIIRPNHDGRDISRPDAAGTGTIIRPNHDGRDISRPDAAGTGTIIRPNHDGRDISRPDAAGTGTIIRPIRPERRWRERRRNRQRNNPDEEPWNCHGDHFLAPGHRSRRPVEGDYPCSVVTPNVSPAPFRHIRDSPVDREGFPRRRSSAALGTTPFTIAISVWLLTQRERF